MNRNMPSRPATADLNEVTLFARVAQLGSFSEAARSLRIPVSMVSRKVANLEARIGVLLIKRTTRRLSLTEAGARYFERCAAHLQGLEDAEADLTNARSELEGLLRITVPVALGRGEFLDFVSSFVERHPKVSVDLVVTNQFVDLVSGNVDVAIRFGALPDSSAVGRKLGVSRRVLVASPDYLAKRKAPRAPQDLRDHACVLFRAKVEESVWELVHGKRQARVRVAGPVSANNFETVGQLAARGHGIALVPLEHAIAGERDGSYRRVLPSWSSKNIPVHAVYMGRRFLPAKLQALLSELSAWKTSSWDALR
jgi:DNA-binding transcriptional LysR family regulator